MTRSADLIVIGGGIVGVSVACFAAEKGARVLLLERSRIGRGCSYENAGLIVPGFSLPLARSKSIRDLPGMLFNAAESPNLGLRLDVGLFRWIVEYFKASHPEKTRSTINYLRSLGQESLEILNQWSTVFPPFGLKHRGWLHAYHTNEGFQRGKEDSKALKEAGVEVEILDGSELHLLEPGLSPTCVGGIFFPGEAEVEPYALVMALAEVAQKKGAKLVEGTHAVEFVMKGNQVSKLRTDDGAIFAGDYVVAAGAWSQKLVQRALGWVPIEPGKGYSITTSVPHRSPHLPLLMGESRIVITPLSGQLRLTTGLDLVGFKPGVDEGRIRDLQEAGSRWLRNPVDKGPWRKWFGFRPMTPDGLPLVGKSGMIENLWIASGHGQRGMTLAPVTAKLIVDLMTDREPVVDPDPLSPDRFQSKKREEQGAPLGG